ncbi:MAG: hypothetical protein RSB55_08965 [Oscillospiraceae bacterium]
MQAKEKQTKRQREDAALNRVLLWFGGAVLLELLVLLMNRFYINFDTTSTQVVFVLSKVILVLIWAGALGAIGSAAWLVTCRMAKKPLLVPTALLVASASVAACCFITLQWRNEGVRLLYTLIPAAAVLALIYYLYQREFFTVSLLSGGALFSTWTLWKAAGTPSTGAYLLCAVVGALALAVALLARVLQKGDGVLVRGEKKLRLLPKKATYSCIYLTCGITAAILLCGLIFGAVVAYAALFVAVAWIFIMAVYYTVRLM